jgi:hypothetical protein
MELVNGYYCRNCSDVELAKKNIDPAHPKQELSGGEVYVPPHGGPGGELGVNRPEESGPLGRHLNLRA